MHQDSSNNYRRCRIKLYPPDKNLGEDSVTFKYVQVPCIIILRSPTSWISSPLIGGMVFRSTFARLLCIALASLISCLIGSSSRVLAQANIGAPIRCFLSLGQYGTAWFEVSDTATCTDCQKLCSGSLSCYNYIWTSSLDCHADSNSCPRSVHSFAHSCNSGTGCMRFSLP